MMIRSAYALGSALLAACLIAVPGPAPGQPPANGKAKELSPELVTARAILSGAATAESTQTAAAQVGKKEYPVFHIEFASARACAAFNPKGVHVFSRHEEFADVFVASEAGFDALDALRLTPDFVWWDLGPSAVVPPPPSAKPGEKARDLLEEVARGGEAGLDGKGVIVAVVDTGIDFRHPDFIEYDADGKPTSRLLYFWDTLTPGPAPGEPGSKAPLTYPENTSIGTVYTREELTAELRSDKKRIPVTDDQGHGTSCASVAAGNGNAAEKEQKKSHSGVAPKADLIGVRIGGQVGMPNTYLMNAICGWIDAMATKHGQPVVVSYSVGGQYGAHDGSLVLERQLSRRFPAGAIGRAICVAAGNEGLDALHAEIEFGGEDKKGELTWVSVNKQEIAIYCDTADPKDLAITGPKSARVSYHPLAKSVLCVVKIEPSRTGKPIPDRLSIYSKSGKKIHADAYLPGVTWKGYFTGDCARYGKQISFPASAEGVIAVGSFDWNNKFHHNGRLIDLAVEIGKNGTTQDGQLVPGSLSAYSNPGPNRTSKAVKPDLVAPGQYWNAAAPPGLKLDYDTSKRYQLFNGTSAATPYTAGVIALMLQKKASLSYGDVRKLLADNASKNYQGAQDKGDPAKNPGWGHGKLDMKAVRKTLAAIP